MRTQEQAFRTYYAAMTDTELLATAANRDSFIGIAQRVLDDEMQKRDLRPAALPLPAVHHTFLWHWGRHLAERFRHPQHPVST